MFGAAVRLALVISAVAAVLAVTLESFGQLSTARFVSFVFAVGFVASWMVTGRVAERARL